MSYSRGVQGMLPRKILKSRVPQMRFPAFSGRDFAEKDLLLMIRHSHRRPPQFLLGFHPFTGVVLSGVASSIIEGVHIHIFVFTDRKNNTFQKGLITQNTNI